MIKKALALTVGTVLGYTLGVVMLVVWATNREYKARFWSGPAGVRFDRND